MAKNTNASNSYPDLMNKINELIKQAVAIRKQESSSVLANIRQKMKEFGLTEKDLSQATVSVKAVKPQANIKKISKPANATKNISVASKDIKVKKAPVQKINESKLLASETVRKNKFSERRKPEPKYMNPETGQTWSGRGKTPTWLQGRRKSRFAIVTPQAVAA